MKCPNCNNEVLPEWKTCPYCEHKPKLCSKISCNSGWLSKDAHFCPLCGSPIKGEENLMLREYIEEAIRKKIDNSPRIVSVQKERIITVGDILCRDNTIMPSARWPVAGKNAKGVVFFVDNSNQHGWAVHLQNQGNRRWMQSDALDFNFKTARDDINGFSNTQAIRTAGGASAYPAAYAVDFERGWYLPALRQLEVLFENKDTINAVLKKIKGAHLLDGKYWSSTRDSNLSYFAWAVHTDGKADNYSVSNIYQVRGVRTF